MLAYHLTGCAGKSWLIRARQMLDGKWKHLQDPFWDRLGRVLARRGITANQVTWAGTWLMWLQCGLFLWHRQLWVFGVGIGLTELLDDLDGAVARVTNTRSAYGAYLDAVTDRYKEIAVYAALASVLSCFGLGFACITGALLTSYNKARAAMERPLSNDGWPDLFERLERIAILVAALVLSPWFQTLRVWKLGFVELGLAVIAVGTHLTAVQRFLRARTLLSD